MLTSIPAAWTVRGASFALWALAGASAVAWGLKLSGNPYAVTVPPSPARQVAAVDPAALARLLGGTPAATGAPMTAPSLASRFQLLGVAAGAHSGRGAAVISVDGKPARSYRVGATLEEGIVLQAVHGREAELGAPGRNEPLVVLQVPALKMESVQAGTTATGSAPAAPAFSAPAAPVFAPPAEAPAAPSLAAPASEPTPAASNAPTVPPGTAPVLSPRARGG
ncbi:general secretion pathway protein C [Ramlibacter ginsenosidimutans]|uniref:General secretion pathway protein C n=1 Tax=Ramlibacter ginsenosidimutans TaxID=502333 RepID=A0A934WLD8_9BURK|nr:general secretion pathway protein C [Ramlibacter ginsenosidimutans]